jgi:hypothetical protein
MGGINPFFETPKQIVYNLDVQYQLNPSWMIDVASVNSRGMHLLATQAFNIPDLATPTSSINCGVYPSLITPANPTGCVNTNTSTNANQRVPIVGVTADGFSQNGNFGDSQYNAVQASVSKAFSRGLQLKASYTFGQVFTDMTGVEFHGAGGALNFNLPSDHQAQHARADYNRPQRLIISYLYSFPDYHSGEGPLGKLMSGWSVSGVITYQDGLPVTLTDNLGGAAYGLNGAAVAGANVSAQLCPGMTHASIPTQGNITSRLNHYFNLNALADTSVTGATPAAKAACPYPNIGAFPSPGPGLPASPGAMGFGDSGRSILLGPGQANWDTSIVKQTSIKERFNLQFRADFFNTFNHPQFANPGTVVNNANFGVISSTVVGPRIVQLGMKFLF